MSFPKPVVSSNREQKSRSINDSSIEIKQLIFFNMTPAEEELVV
jgi:hypothetical protein